MTKVVVARAVFVVVPKGDRGDNLVNRITVNAVALHNRIIVNEGVVISLYH